MLQVRELWRHQRLQLGQTLIIYGIYEKVDADKIFPGAEQSAPFLLWH
jgi:hypothetical protein